MFHAPIDLSDLPGYQAPESLGPRRIAFVGCCSTKDRQDPRSSIAGQLAEASALLEAGERFVGHYWDVESGMLGLDERSQVTDADYARLDIPVPRDGGVTDLLEAAERGEIDAVACERINRIARDMLTSLLVEHRLHKLGVAVEAANEPRGGGMDSGRLELRRTAQVRAEVARHEMVEMSMRGQRQHAANGYQHGYPCYDYIARIDPEAPQPPTGRFGGGRPKKRLVLHPDPRRPATVAEVFRLRRQERADDTAISRLLAADPDRHPLAERQPAWTPQRIATMLAQPKYTGYQCYNRRANRTGKGRLNPISEWVWSSEPAHPAIVPLQQWRDTQLVTAQMRRPAGSGWDRVHAAAVEHGITLTKVRANDHHVLYLVGARQIVLPRGELARRGRRPGPGPDAGVRMTDPQPPAPLIVDAVRHGAAWVTLPGDHGVIVTARTLIELAWHAADAVALRRDQDTTPPAAAPPATLPTVPPVVQLRPTSPELRALADARRRYQAALPGRAAGSGAAAARRPRHLARHRDSMRHHPQQGPAAPDPAAARALVAGAAADAGPQPDEPSGHRTTAAVTLPSGEGDPARPADPGKDDLCGSTPHHDLGSP